MTAKAIRIRSPGQGRSLMSLGFPGPMMFECLSGENRKSHPLDCWSNPVTTRIENKKDLSIIAKSLRSLVLPERFELPTYGSEMEFKGL